jgi:hypothetical protein
VDSRTVVLVVLGVIAIGWYYYCLISIGRRGRKDQPTGYQQLQSWSVTSISTTLATFVGLVLGLKGFAEETQRSKEAAAALQPSVVQIGKVVAAEPALLKEDQKLKGEAPEKVKQEVKKVETQADEVTSGLQRLLNAANPSWFQWGAMILYILSLFIAIGFWGAREDDKVDPGISHLGRSLLGLLVGALSAALAVPVIM